MSQQVVSKTKLLLDDDFNIIDPEVDIKKKEAIININNQIEELNARRSWLIEDIYDIDQEILDLKETLKGYGV